MNRYKFSFLFNKLTWNDQEVKKPAKEEKLNESTASSEQSSSGPEFEIINSDDVPAVEEIQVNTSLQGCSGNSDDRNWRKPVRITQLVRITRTMCEKCFCPKTDF